MNTNGQTEKIERRTSNIERRMPRHPDASSKSICGSTARLFLAAALGFGTAAFAAPPLSDDTLRTIQFEQKLNTRVSLDLPFVDEAGKPVRLGNYFGRKPVILVLGYYGCPMLCTLTLNGMVEGLEDMKWVIGKDFQVVNVSIDPHETPALAAAKKQVYLKRYGRAGAAGGWHFLTGHEVEIRKLTDEVGFRYVYDPASQQYAHPSGLVILTPQGKVSHYLFGVTFASRDLFSSLQDASVEKAGSPIEQFVLLCFHYNPIGGKYGARIMVLVRIFSGATIAGLAWLLVSGMRSKKAPAPAPRDGL